MVDTTTSTFSTISIAAAGVTADAKYMDAIAVSTKVYFVPRTEDNVGVLDTTTSTFSTIDTTAAGVTGNEKYGKASAVGDFVYMTPYTGMPPRG